MKLPNFSYTKVVPALDHYTRGRKLAPQIIILHATAGTDSKKWLSITSNPPVSIHILVDKQGNIIRIVEDNDTAWHAGFGVVGPFWQNGTYDLNDISLGLEFENLNNGIDPYPADQLRGGAIIVSWWYALYGLLPMLYHMTVDVRKHDPAGFPRYQFDHLLADQLKELL